MLTTDYRNSNPARLIEALRGVQHYTRYEFDSKDSARATSWHFYNPQGGWLATIKWPQNGPTQVACVEEVKELMR